LYCAAGLELNDLGGVKLAFRTLEAWEKGWNVVLTGGNDSISEIRKVAGILSMDGSDLERVIASSVGMPIVRVESEAEAEMIQRSLSGSGVRTVIVSDTTLEGERPPVRLFGLKTIGGIGAIDFNTREVVPLGSGDIAIIVTGTVETSKTDLVEKRRRRKTKLLNEVATVADESLIDIYTRTDATGYRIQMSGFDFSCLGSEKALLASENIRHLITFLKAQFPNARVVDAYDEIRDLLITTWPLQVKKDHKGLVYAGMGKREFGKSESTNNLEQFTKFSRLQWHLL